MGKLIDDEPMGNKTFKSILVVGFIIFAIVIIASIFLPHPKERGKYIDDKKAGVVWIINEKGDTVGTVQ